MAQKNVGLEVKKPVSAWNRPLQADAKGIFKSLANGVVHAATGQWTALGTDAIDGVTALGLNPDPGEIAWLLIRRALLAAMVELAKERLPPAAEPAKAALAERSDRLDEAIGGAEVTIDGAFFEKPAQLPLLETLRTPFAE